MKLYINKTALVMPADVLSGEPLSPELLAQQPFTAQQVASLEEYARLVSGWVDGSLD